MIIYLLIIMIYKTKSPNKEFKKGLYLVSTPIGNLGDLTFRAVETLKNSDVILCEDTRISKNLLNKFEINKKLISNHKFNERKNVEKIIKILNSGSLVTLISDAGTPAISDPGRILIKACVENNIEVIPIPGASAVSSAVSISGFLDKFFFYGFFPEKKKDLERDLKILSEINCSIIFFISSKKINKLIPSIKFFFDDRKILICREMTKIYEEFIRTDVKELKQFENNPRGELTIVISEKKVDKNLSNKLSESDKKEIAKMINKISVKEVTKIINKKSNISKKEIYQYCLRLKNEI